MEFLQIHHHSPLPYIDRIYPFLKILQLLILNFSCSQEKMLIIVSLSVGLHRLIISFQTKKQFLLSMDGQMIGLNLG